MTKKTDSKEFRKGLLQKVLIRFFIGFLLFGILIFFPAGTLRFFNGWLFLCAFLVPMIFALAYLLFRDPELLEKRVGCRHEGGFLGIFRDAKRFGTLSYGHRLSIGWANP